MNQATAQILNRIAEVENRVLKGFVLDEHGAWIPIADRKIVEEEFLSHLSVGQVLLDSRWVSIAEARAARRGTAEPHAAIDVSAQNGMAAAGAASVPALSATVGAAIDFPPETTQIPMNLLAEAHKTAIGPVPAGATEAKEFPPETKAISIESERRVVEESLAAASREDIGFAPETSLFRIERIVPPAVPGENEARQESFRAKGHPAIDREAQAVFLSSDICSWEKDAAKRKKRTLVAGVIIVALAGLGAVAVILNEIIR